MDVGQYAGSKVSIQLLKLFLLTTLAGYMAVEVRAQAKSCGVAICLLWDESGSVGQNGFNSSKAFMTNLVESLSNVSSGSMYGLVTFETNVTPLLSLTSDTGTVLQTIANNQYNRGGTNTEAGLRACYSQDSSGETGILAPGRGWDGQMSRMVILFTDGQPSAYERNRPGGCQCDCSATGTSLQFACVAPIVECFRCSATVCYTDEGRNCSIQPAYTAADVIRQAGIKIVSVAVGSAVNNNSTGYNFLKIVGGNATNGVITSADFSALTGIIDDVTRSACTDIDLSVSCSSGVVGSQLSLQANLSNTAAFEVKPPIQFEVTLTNGLTNLTVGSSVNGPAATCVSQNANNTRYSCTAGNSNSAALEPGASWRYSFTSTPTQPGTSSSTVTYIPSGPDNNDVNNVATCNTTIIPASNVGITKSVTTANVMIGSTVNYNILVSNAPNTGTATGITMFDSLQSGLEFVSLAGLSDCSLTNSNRNLTCTIASLAGGASRTYPVQVRAVDAGVWNASATVTSQTADSNLNNNGPVIARITVTQTCGTFFANGSQFTCSNGYQFNQTSSDVTNPSLVTCCVQLFPDVGISAPADRSGLIASNINYPITVSNSGGFQASSVVVTVKLPAELVYQSGPGFCTVAAGTVTCNLPGNLAVGSNTTLDLVLKPTGAGPYTVNSTVSCPDDSNAANNGPVIGIITVQRTCAVFSYSTTAGRTEPFDCGEGYSWRNGVGEANITNCCSQLFADLIITAPDDMSVPIGSNVAYPVVVTNNGSFIATNVTVVMILPNDLEYEQGPSGCNESPRGTVTCIIPGSIPVDGNHTLTISVRPVGDGPYTVQSEVSAPSDPTASGPASSTIRVTKSCAVFSYNTTAGGTEPFICGEGFSWRNGTGEANRTNCCVQLFPDVGLDVPPAVNGLIGSNITFPVIVSNNGSVPASNVTVEVELPPGVEFVSGPGCTVAQQVVTCVIPSDIAPGSNYTVPIVIKPTGPGPHTIDTSVTAPTDPDTSNNGPVETIVTVTRSCAVYTSTGGPFECPGGYRWKNGTGVPGETACCDSLANLVVTAPPTVNGSIGSNITYPVTITNNGGVPATNVTVVVQLPPGVEFVPGPGCTANQQVVVCPNLGPIPVNGSITVPIVIKPTGPGPYSLNTTVSSPDNPTSPAPVITDVIVIRTCAVYYADGSRFTCPAGFSYNSNASSTAVPGDDTCCVRCTTCADLGGAACGSNLSDGCGGTLSCTCGSGTTCSASTAGQQGTCIAQVPCRTCSDFAVAGITACGTSLPVGCSSDVINCPCSNGLVCSATAAETVGFCQSPAPVPSDVSVAAALSDTSTLIGNSLVLTVVVTNRKTSSTSGVSASVNLPAGLVADSTRVPTGCTLSDSTANGQVLTCNIGELAGSASQTLLIPVTATRTGTLTAQASAGAPNDDDTTNNGPVPASVSVVQTCGQFNPDKTRFDCGSLEFNSSAVSNSSPSTATCCSTAVAPQSPPDVSVSITVPSSLPVNTPFTITIGVKVEAGTDGAQGVTVTYTIPDGLQLAGTLDAAKGCGVQGSKITCSLGNMALGRTESIPVSLTATRAGEYTNTASVSAISDSNAANNVASKPVTILGACCSRALGTCSQVPTLSDCSAGDFLADKNCQNAQCQIPLPTSACCSATLGTCLGELTQDNCTRSGGRWQDGVATCSLANCTLPDPTPQAAADVAITTDLSADSVLIAGSVEWTITVTNIGDAEAKNVKITANLPSGLQYGLVSGCTTSGQVLTCATVPSMAAGAQLTFVVPVTATSANTFTFSAQVVADQDGNTANNGPTSDTLVVTRTCARYNSDGSKFPCNALSQYNGAAGSNPNPSQDMCCTDRPIDPTAGPDVSLSGSIKESMKVGEQANLVYKVKAEEGNFGRDTVRATISVPANLKIVSLPAGCELVAPSKRRFRCTIGSALSATGARKEVTLTIPVEAVRAVSRLSIPGSVTAPRDNNGANNDAAPTLNILAACCTDGACQDVVQQVCRNGVFTATKSCATATCRVRPAQISGACCVDSKCTTGLTRRACLAQSSTARWRRGDSCAFCKPAASPLGACCLDQTAGTCQFISRSACAEALNAAGGGSITAISLRWRRGKSCTDFCPARGGGSCTAAWQACNPRASTCCAGTACQAASITFPNVEYVCKPASDSCRPVSGICGDCDGGGVCCPGLECKWDARSSRGYCRNRGQALAAASAGCNKDLDCDSGSRCVNRQCKAATCREPCNGDAECEKDCEYVKGDRAARLGMVVKVLADGTAAPW